MTRNIFVIAVFALAPAATFAEGSERDPMQPPAAARPPAPAPSAPLAGQAAADGAWRPRYLIASDGKRWLVQNGRRHGVGDALGAARIERIDDDAVWLREAGRLTRVPLFGGVAKKASTSPVQPTISAERKERQP